MTEMNKRPLSLQLRVALYTGLAISIGLALLLNMVHHSIREHFAEQDRQELTLLAAGVQQVLYNWHHQHTDDHSEQALEAPLPESLKNQLDNTLASYHGLSVQLWSKQGEPWSEQGELLFQGGNAQWPLDPEDVKPRTSSAISTPAISTPAIKKLQEWMADGRPYRGCDLTINSPVMVHLRLASDMSFHKRFMSEFRSTLWLIVLSIGALTLIAVVFAIHQGHAPLRQLARDIATIRSDQLHQRLDTERQPQELQPLLNAFNQMLAGLEEGFERLSNYSADIAHELRTPLTNLITQTQVMLSQPRSLEEYRELLYSSLEEEERLTRMVSDMLWLAKADNGQQVMKLTQCALEDEMTDLLEFFEALADEKDVGLTLTGTAPEIMADRNMLRRAINNLLSNALRHAPEHSQIEVTLSEKKQSEGKQRFACLQISNTGAPIPAEHLPHLFERFYRADPSRHRSVDNPTDNSGLGLAITRSIVQLHQGKISVESDQTSTRFYLYLPAEKS